MPSPRILVPVVLLAASLGTARADAPKRPLTPEQAKARDLLASTDPDTVRKDLTPYRPLCDADGYPVVGNATGSSKAARLEPSEYCSLVRAAAEKARTRK